MQLILEEYQLELTNRIREARTSKEPLRFKQIIKETLEKTISVEKSTITTEGMFSSYMQIGQELVTYSLEINDYKLGDSVYQNMFPRFAPAFFEEEDMERKKRQWISYPDLIMNYFTIQHNLTGIRDETISSLGTILKWLKPHMGFFQTKKTLFFNMLLDTHERWKEEMKPEEEESFWVVLSQWIFQEYINMVPDDISLYKKMKGFYTAYKKTERLEPLAYRMVEYVMLIIGFGEEKIELSVLVDKATIFLKHMKQPFCDKHGKVLSSLFSDVLMEWEPTGHTSDVHLMERLVKEINATAYKKKIFSDILAFCVNISNWSERKAYPLISYAYVAGILSDEDIEENGFIIAYSLSSQNRKQEAKSIYESLLERGQESGAVFNNLAVIYRDKDKELEKALEYFERAAKIDPEEELYQRNIKDTLEYIKKEKERPKRQLDAYFKKADKQLRSICFTIYKLEDQGKVTTEAIEQVMSYKDHYLQKLLNKLKDLDLTFYTAEKGWQLVEAVRDKVADYVDPKLERQIIRNNQAALYRPIFYHESEINLYRVLLELFPQHFVFPNMDLKTIIQVEKIRSYIQPDELDYMFKAHVDFAIIDTTTYFPILTFEKDSDFQDEEQNKVNAIKKNRIFEASGLPLIRIRYNSAMDYERLKEEIKQATKDYILFISGNKDAETKRILDSIDPKRFGVMQGIPTEEELKGTWENIVGSAVASHTEFIQLDIEQSVLRVAVKETARPVLEIGADNIKSKLYQQYPVLNSILFIWV